MIDDTLADTVDLSPSLAPLSADQEQFVELHRNRLVVKYQWFMQGALFRAYTDRGRTATISAADAQDLVDRGLFEWGVNKAYMRKR